MLNLSREKLIKSNGDLFRRVSVLVLVSGISVLNLFSQSFIKGRIDLDTTRWAPIAYLSLIPDFNQMFSMSNEAIVQRAAVDREGNFSFDTKSLMAEDRLYRIHFSKRGEPSASLIIGGQEENHLFLVANQNSDIGIRIRSGPNLINGPTFSGYTPNKALLEINQIAGFLDTLDYYGPAVNRDFVRQAVYDRLRQYADTCSNPLISLYAIYHSRFESDFQTNPLFYKRYFRKWKHENSEYFRAFRAQVPVKEPPAIPWLPVGGVVILAGGALIYLRTRKKIVKNPFQTLTVQERKIFGLLKEGRSNKEVSEECGISLSTVKSHVNSIYAKLKISSRTDVMDWRSDK